MRYDRAYSLLASRAVRQGGVDADTFMEMAAEAGISAKELEKKLLEDLENDGPVFGKFNRSLQGAAKTTVTAAHRQGQVAADALDEGFLTEEDYLALLDGADPEALAEVEAEVRDDMEYTWVATLVNTCFLCLPLHGHSRTMAEWEELGFLPEVMHEGWSSACQCELVPTAMAEGQQELRSPLVRAKVEKGSKRTARAVTQLDMDKAIAAMQKARESVDGRRVLRALGQVASDE